jgi:hypothetical protein
VPSTGCAIDDAAHTIENIAKHCLKFVILIFIGFIPCYYLIEFVISN